MMDTDHNLTFLSHSVRKTEKRKKMSEIKTSERERLSDRRLRERCDIDTRRVCSQKKQNETSERPHPKQAIIRREIHVFDYQYNDIAISYAVHNTIRNYTMSKWSQQAFESTRRKSFDLQTLRK